MARLSVVHTVARQNDLETIDTTPSTHAATLSLNTADSIGAPAASGSALNGADNGIRRK